MSDEKLEEIADGYQIKRNHKTTDLFSLAEAGGISPIYKLTYFQNKALAEPAKYLMKYGGIDFDETRNDEDTSSARELANNSEYNQSIAVSRFFAKQVKLMGNDDLEDFEIDSIVDTVNDLRLNISFYYNEREDRLKEKLFEKTIPFYFQWLDRAAERNEGYLACRKLTWADLYFVSLLDYMKGMTNSNLILKYLHLQMVEKNVLAIPSIENWLKSRPITS